MKKTYIAPAVEIVKMASSQIVCDSPQAHNQVSSKPSYSKERSTAGDDEFDELW
ncbi:MAG: hypothetical protein IJV06_07355 [Bacteroidaceae bacterium]|nr:hypothetical protein [Bacteroidaceae bacterium]